MKNNNQESIQRIETDIKNIKKKLNCSDSLHGYSLVLVVH